LKTAEEEKNLGYQQMESDDYDTALNKKIVGLELKQVSKHETEKY